MSGKRTPVCAGDMFLIDTRGLRYREKERERENYLPNAFTVFRIRSYDISCESLNHHITRLNEPSNESFLLSALADSKNKNSSHID